MARTKRSKPGNGGRGPKRSAPKKNTKKASNTEAQDLDSGIKQAEETSSKLDTQDEKPKDTIQSESKQDFQLESNVETEEDVSPICTSDFTPINEPAKALFTPINASTSPQSKLESPLSPAPLGDSIKKEEPAPLSTPPRRRTTRVKAEPTGDTLSTPSISPTTPKRKAAGTPATPRTKKPKLQLGTSPFPLHLHPTQAEAYQVVNLLRNAHGHAVPPAELKASLTVTGCGEVPLILDALIRTVISANTSIANSACALAGIVAAYGSKDGTIDYDAIHAESVGKLEQAMKSGGLAGVKSKSIKGILDEVSAENVKAGRTGDLVYSLEHLRPLPSTEIMAHLMSYRGVGVKIAACVVLFCLQRPCLAIDTHCYRMARFLGWVPEKATADDTFYHLDAVVPDEIKYDLHELFMRHGQRCKKCNREGPSMEVGKKKKERKGKKVDVEEGEGEGDEVKKDVKEEGSVDAETDVCVLEEFVTRVWKKKGKKE